MAGLIQRMLAPASQRIRLMVGRAVVKLINDAAKLQELQVQLLADELRGRAERFQQYGLTSHPHPGAEAIGVSVGGARGHFVVLAVDDRRYRKRDLAEGEVALYTDEGDYILLKRGRIIEVVAGTKLDVTAPEVDVHASTKVRFETPLVEATGDMHVTGTITADTAVVDPKGSMQEMRDQYNGHVHGSSPGPTPVMN